MMRVLLDPAVPWVLLAGGVLSLLWSWLSG